MNRIPFPDMKRPLIAILRGIRPDEIESVVGALIENGLTAIEIPLNSPDPFKSIEIAAKMAPAEVLIGAGTVLTVEAVNSLNAAGGKLLDGHPVMGARQFQNSGVPFARIAHGGSNLFEFDQRAIEIFRMQKQHRLAMRPGPRRAVAQHPGAAGFQRFRGSEDVGHLEADVMHAAGRVLVEESGNGGGVAQGFEQFHLGIAGIDEDHGDTMLGEGLRLADMGAE